MIDRDPAHLCPKFRSILEPCLEAFNKANPQHTVAIFEGLRSAQRQGDLFAIGRTIDGAPCSHKGVICPLGTCGKHPRGLNVTNAPPWMSWHQYGLSADVVFDADPIRPGPQFTWDGKQPWPSLGLAFQRAGLEWAGAWTHFPEFPHVQKTWGIQLTAARTFVEQGGLHDLWEVCQ